MLDLPKLVPLSFSHCSIYNKLSVIVVSSFFPLCALNYVFYVFSWSHSSLCWFIKMCFGEEKKRVNKAKKKQPKTKQNSNIKKKFCVGSFGRDIFIRDCCTVLCCAVLCDVIVNLSSNVLIKSLVHIVRQALALAWPRVHLGGHIDAHTPVYKQYFQISILISRSRRLILCFFSHFAFSKIDDCFYLFGFRF